MEKKEALMEHIEKERMILNSLIGSSSAERIYRQSLLLDGLIEQYMGHDFLEVSGHPCCES